MRQASTAHGLAGAGRYGPNSRCVWVLLPCARAAARLLRVEELSLEHGADFLTIYDGAERSSVPYSIEHSIEHSTEHSIDHSIDHSIEYSVEHSNEDWNGPIRRRLIGTRACLYTCLYTCPYVTESWRPA